jgi:phenylacetate-CoA ligase
MDESYWNRQIETIPRKELEKKQLQLFREQAKYCFEKSSVYHRKFKEAGITPEDIKTHRDIQKVPFTIKDDFRDNYPLGMLCVNADDIIEIHSSSGTTGNPVVGAYTRNDMDVWRELMARSLYTTGVRSNDVVHISYGYGLFTGGLGFHYGAQGVGATVVPASAGMTQRQVKLMKDLGATVLCCTPSFAVYLAETMRSEKVKPRSDLKLKRGLFGAEPWSEKIRERIELELGIEAFDVYGLTELCGPGVSIECNVHNGLHVWEDHFLAETIDPKTGETLQPGEKGELVFTSLTKTGLPVLRYRTRDISVLETEKCSCGRTHARMVKVTGRSDDMLKIKGVNVFPSQIEYAIMGFPELACQYLIVLDRPGALDTFTVKVELAENTAKDTRIDLNDLIRRILERIHNITGLCPDLELVKPGVIPRSDGKAKRVLDLRQGKT